VQSEQILAGSTITFLRRVSGLRTYTCLFIYAAQRKLWVQLAAAESICCANAFACSAAKHLSLVAEKRAPLFGVPPRSVKITCMELCQ
jgi:hypothetical protein